RFCAQGLTDAQAAQTPTASALSIGGIVKHVTRMEARWTNFMVHGTSAMQFDESSYAAHAASFEFGPEDNLEVVLKEYDERGRTTDELVAGLASLDDGHPLPEAPWFPQGARWSARRVVAHLIMETAQHAGHADIIRETLDGQKTMG
ncbi:MAG TPA: DinB family protein, partial [Acidimicrobiales bacterium]|nr:DinB family protein [Acidimicrobiales bacterium]